MFSISQCVTLFAEDLKGDSLRLNKEKYITLGSAFAFTYLEPNFEFQRSGLYGYRPFYLEVTKRTNTRLFYSLGFEYHWRDLSGQNLFDNIKINSSNIRLSTGWVIDKNYPDPDQQMFLKIKAGYSGINHLREVKATSPQYGLIPDISQTKLHGIDLGVYHGVFAFINSRKFVVPIEWGVSYKHLFTTNRILDNIESETKGLNLWQVTLELKFGFGVVLGESKKKEKKSEKYYVD